MSSEVPAVKVYDEEQTKKFNEHIAKVQVLEELITLLETDKDANYEFQSKSYELWHNVWLWAQKKKKVLMEELK